MRPGIVKPGESDDVATNELLESARDGWYGDAAFFGAMAHRPALLDGVVSLFEQFPQSDRISQETLELMRLKVADVHQCAYCSTVRTEEVKAAVEPKESAVFGEVDEDELTRREVLSVRLAEQLSRDPHRLTDEFFGELREEFSEAEAVELLLFASLEVGLDRFCIALELDTTEESPYPSGLTYPYERPDSADE